MDDLQRARDRLRTAIQGAEEPAATELQAVADDLDELAAGEAMADHAVVDGYLNELRQAKQRADAAVANEIDAAIDELSSYRDGLEQG